MTEQDRDRVIEIEATDKRASIRIAMEERCGDPLPSRRLAMEAKLGDFGGRHERAWVEDGALRRFVTELEVLERTRRGGTRLEAMSPGEFVLGIQVIDDAGHVVVTFELRRDLYVGRTRQRVGLHGGFELDASALPALVRAFAELAI